MEYHIKTEALGKTYGGLVRRRGVDALKSLSIEVPAGTIMGFIGRNGAGKTTTIKILLGLVAATRGSAWVMGEDVRHASAREHVSYMPEVPALDNRDNAVSFFDIVGRIIGMKQRDIVTRRRQVLEEVGLQDKEAVPFAAYSRGMKQRFELAQVFFSRPRLMILDEPFSGLDPVGRVEIRDLIKRYNREEGATVFFSSHILTDVEVLCDSIGILDQGELKAVGDKNDLLGVASIEVSGQGMDTQGLMFLEKMVKQVNRDSDNRVTVILDPDQDADKVVDLMKRYHAQDVSVQRSCKSLEAFFSETVSGQS